ncbi:MAG TPA: DUF4384 domain-containing protein [Hyphomicrobiales bacterium]|nr:DUF4384 domain-containing protein [Hyphomicrobiales bacterium]
MPKPPETALPPAEPAAAPRLAALSRPAPLPPAPAVDPRPGVRQALAGLDCARVEATVADGVVTLSGHTRAAADRRRLEQTLAAVPGVRRVDAAGLRLLGDPYCRILDFLARPGLVRSTDQHADLAALGTRAEAGVAHFSGGTPLSLGLSAPEYDSYLYVDYFAADGSVAHLLPRAHADNHFGADEKFVLGPGGRGLVATIGPPFGLDVVVALASSAPLPLDGRPVAEDAGAYLASLDAALGAMRRDHPDFRVEYAYFLIYTAAPGAPAAGAGADSAASARAR